jgi:hypothetical protein
VLLIVDWHYINTHNILPVKNSDNAVINDMVRVITSGRKTPSISISKRVSLVQLGTTHTVFVLNDRHITKC